MIKKLGFILVMIAGLCLGQYGTQQTLTLHAPSANGRAGADGTFTLDNLNYSNPVVTLTVPLVSPSYLGTITGVGAVDWINVVGNKPIVDVRSYGAIGDCVTNDAPAIQLAIDSLATSGGTVMFPHTGTSCFGVSSQINLNHDGVKLLGSSKGYPARFGGRVVNGTRIKLLNLANLTGAVIQVSASSNTIEGLEIDANAGGQTAGSVDGIRFLNASGARSAYGTVRDVTVSSASRNGIRVQDTTGISSYDVGTIDNSIIVDNDFDCIALVDVADWTIANSNIGGCSNASSVIAMAGGAGHIIHHNIMFTADGYGVKCFTCNSVTLTGNSIRESKLSGILINGGTAINKSRHIIINGNEIVDNSRSPIHTSSGVLLGDFWSHISITGNKISNKNNTWQQVGVTTDAGGNGDTLTIVGNDLRGNFSSPVLLAGTLVNLITYPNNGLSLDTRAGSLLNVGGNAIAPTNELHHVGAGLIKNITLPSGFVDGCIKLVPDAAFTYDNTGNMVVPAGGGTAVVNRLMLVCYDGAKWTPSY